MTANPYELERRLIKEEVVSYYEQKDEAGNRVICKETKIIAWNANDEREEDYSLVEYFQKCLDKAC